MRRSTLVLAAVAALAACGESTVQSIPAVPPVPQGFPPMAIPESNPYSAEKAEFGRHLFYDRRLSGNQTQSCADCHQQQFAFAEPLTVSIGSQGHSHFRNSMSLANVGYNATYTWSGRALVQLEQQIPIPLFGEDPIEMDATGNEDAILARIRSDEVYKRLFNDAYDMEISSLEFSHVIQGLAHFVRTITSGTSRVDQFVAGEINVLSSDERTGMDLFFSERLECHHCHGGFNYTDSVVLGDSAREPARPLHNNGLYNVGNNDDYPAHDQGLYNATGRTSDRGLFRAPTLRNIAHTAPYMHDGSIATLEEVMHMYARGGRKISEGPYAGDGAQNTLKDPLVSGFAISATETEQVLAFLRALSDQDLLDNPKLANPWSLK